MTSTLHPSCRKATELIERGMVVPLGLRDRAGLWLHLRICDGCRAYRDQSMLIDRWLRRRRDEGVAPEAPTVVAEILDRTVGNAK